MGVASEFLEELETTIRSEGFFLSGVAPAVSPEGFHPLVQWVNRGFAGEMDYFADRIEAYEHPSMVLASVRSLLVLALPYPPEEISREFSEATRQGSLEGTSHENASESGLLPISQGGGKLARYLWGRSDYHDRIHRALKRIRQVFLKHYPFAHVRGVVDTAPLLEREFAQLAGLGWRGKNTLLINRWRGSYFFLAAILSDLDLPISAPHETSHCGSCTRCIDACPTDAFPEPGVLDATRCISYLTIEHRSPIPRELRAGIGEWLFGCDICQEVCPWNIKAEKRRDQHSRLEVTGNVEPEHSEMQPVVALSQLFELDEESFRVRFRKTPLWRAKRRGILRNAAIVLGNQRDRDSISALRIGMHDSEPLVRGAVAWALARIGTRECEKILTERLTMESDTYVREEIIDGLNSVWAEDNLA